MKTIQSAIATITCVFTVLTFNASGQTIPDGEDYFQPLKIKFRVVNHRGENLKGCSYSFYKNNSLVQQKTMRGSRQKLKCERQSIYTLKVSYPDHVEKIIAVYLNHENAPLYNDVYKFVVELEPEARYSGFYNAEDYLDYPAAILEYDEQSAEYTYNQAYLASSRHAKNKLYESELNQLSSAE